MRKLLLAAVAAAAIASPAMARDGTGYVGAELGALLAKDSDWDRRFGGGDYVNFLDIDHKLGFDSDLVAGYDFGMFRLEGELGYKRARHKEYSVDTSAPGPFPIGIAPGSAVDAEGRTSILSGMVNALVDIGDDEGTSFYAGGGVGLARVSQTVDQLSTSKYHLKDNDLAWQLIAGVRTAISPNMDAGLKYRYFSAGPIKSDLYGVGFDARTSFKSHSLLASLIYNFAPPPPPPATQTCPDGSVILATDACPVPVPPPPPPPPTVERG